MGIKIVVFGGRGFSDQEGLWSFLDDLNWEYEVTEVIHGDAQGADTLARRWAESRGIKQTAYPPKYDRLPAHVAPLARNQDMVDARPDMGVMCVGGSGTEDMRRRMDAAGIEVRELPRRKITLNRRG